MGLRLLVEVVRYARLHDALPAKPQDEAFATRAPRLDPPPAADPAPPRAT